MSQGLFPQTRDPAWLEDGRYNPLTQPLSWALDSALSLFTTLPWWCLVPLILLGTLLSSKSWKISTFVAISFVFFLFTDHYGYAIQTLSIIFVCTVLCTFRRADGGLPADADM